MAQVQARQNIPGEHLRVLVRRDDETLIGTLYVTEDGVGWRPPNVREPITVPWEEFIEWMTE